jgi:hypothetical protein
MLLCLWFVFVFLSFSGEARFLVLSRFLQPACLFYTTLGQKQNRYLFMVFSDFPSAEKGLKT